MARLECGIAMPGIPGGFHPDALVQIGPTALVTVSQPAVDPAKPPQSRAVLALIDTGAASSCIDATLATTLGLPIIDKIQIAGAGGANEHDVVMGKISIASLGLEQAGKFACVHLAAGGQPHQVLIGRDMLKSVVLYYDGHRGFVSIHN